MQAISLNFIICTFQTPTIWKNELIFYDFGRVPLHFDYLHFKKNPITFVSEPPMFHGTRFPSFQGVDTCLINIQGGSVPQVPDVQQTRGKPQRFERLEFCWFVFFPLKKKHKAQTKQAMVRLRKKVCLKGNVN